MSSNKKKLQNFEHGQAEYNRPNQKWQCGHLCDGQSCYMGPSSGGGCQSSCECLPKKVGDRWYCTRSASKGGECANGPGTDGNCACQLPPCQPRLSLRHHRLQDLRAILPPKRPTQYKVLSQVWMTPTVSSTVQVKHNWIRLFAVIVLRNKHWILIIIFRNIAGIMSIVVKITNRVIVANNRRDVCSDYQNDAEKKWVCYCLHHVNAQRVRCRCCRPTVEVSGRAI